jgi:putative addiction module component (TIGR02574 family)
MADRAQVLEDALTLPVEERAQVAHELLRSLEPEDADAGDAWTDEIRRRIDEVETGTAQLDDWETVRR